MYYLRFSASNLRVSSSKSGIWSVLGGGGVVEDLDPTLPGTLLGGAGKSQLDSEKSPSSSYSHTNNQLVYMNPPQVCLAKSYLLRSIIWLRFLATFLYILWNWRKDCISQTNTQLYPLLSGTYLQDILVTTIIGIPIWIGRSPVNIIRFCNFFKVAFDQEGFWCGYRKLADKLDNSLINTSEDLNLFATQRYPYSFIHGIVRVFHCR